VGDPVPILTIENPWSRVDLNAPTRGRAAQAERDHRQTNRIVDASARNPRCNDHAMAITGVLFDFSGTLFRIESAQRWLATVLHEAGIVAAPAEIAQQADELERAGALPGGAPPQVIPAHLAELWATRDESAERHRAAYIGLARQVEMPDPRLYDALYDRHMTPAAWRPYPDAIEVINELKRRGLAVGLISNIGWDLRPVFRAHGLDATVDAFVLSYEHGIQKPSPALFRIACDALGQDPQNVLMVGDDRRADGGAAAIGCAVHFVDHLPVDRRPDGLRPVLALLDQAEEPDGRQARVS
jgi:HAD superfamily hydrolase (TIGR01493 family)